VWWGVVSPPPPPPKHPKLRVLFFECDIVKIAIKLKATKALKPLRLIRIILIKINAK
jgi:hypothetical protein